MELNQIQKQLNIAYQPHPIAPAAGQKGFVAVTDGKTSVRRVLVLAGIDPYQPITIQLDGRLLPVNEWDKVCPNEGQLLSVHATVQGGGGGGSNVIQIVAIIAIMVAAPHVGAAFATATVGAGAASFAIVSGVAAAVFSVAGALVIGALFAPKPPSMPNAPPAVSPTYSLTGGQNRARLYEPMPAVFGTHRVFLDYSARPFSEYRGDDQFLYQIFNLGLGNVTASDFRIGTNSLSSYSNFQLINPQSDGKLLNFPGNVDTSQGGVLTQSAGFIERTTSNNTYQIGIDIEAILFNANDQGGLDATTVDFQIQFRPTGGQYTNATNITINSSGSFSNLGNGNIRARAGTQKPQRATIFISVAPGTYDVRVRRLTADSASTRLTQNTNWSLLRSYQEDTSDYTGQNRVGLIIKATEQLNGVIATLSAIISAEATYWNGTQFETDTTSNPAHWFTHFARGFRDTNGRLLYGVGLLDDQIDFDALHVWAQFCEQEGLTFNAVLDSKQTAADMLNSIATCGLASPSWASGKLAAVFDTPNASPVMTFGMSNIMRETFQVAYISENLAEEIVIRFINTDKDFEQDEVRTLAPDVVTPLRSSAIDLYGCTNEQMAGKFANYLAAQQHFRRRRITWQSDFEGFVCQRGDTVLLSHDLTQFGFSGRFVSAENNVVTLDRTVPRQDQIEFLMLIRPDGSTTTYDIEPSTDEESDTLTIINDVIEFQENTNLIDHRFAFSPLETPGKRLKIMSVQPSTDARLTIVATDDFAEFYDAWDGTFTPPRTDTVLPEQPTTAVNLTVTNRIAVVDGFLTNRVAISWGVGGGTLFSQVKIFLDGNLVGESADTRVPFFQLDINAAGSLVVEVTPFGITGAGLTQTATLNIAELDLPLPPQSVTLTVGENGRSATFQWTEVAGVQSYVVEVFADGAVKRSVNVGNNLSYVYSVADAVADGGPFRSYQVRVFSVNTTGQSTTFATANFNNPQIGQLVNASVDAMPNSIWFSSDTPTEDDYSGIFVFISKTLDFTPNNDNLVYRGTDTFVAITADADGNPLETGRVYFVRAAGFDTFGTDNLTLTGQLSATILSPAFGLVQGDIDQSLLESGLQGRINQIDTDDRLANAELANTISSFTSYNVAENGLAVAKTELRAFTDGKVFAEASARLELAAELENTNSTLDQEQIARATADQALASDITTLTSTVGDNNTAVQVLTQSVDGIEGKFSVKVDNNGFVSGFGLISTANDAVPTSEFLVVADRFAIAPVETNPEAVDGSPFFVLTAPQVINGITVDAGTYIKQAFIYDAVITTAKIENLAVTDAKIANLAVNTAKINNAAITTAKIGDAQITTAKIGDAQISDAKIQDASITDAKILNLNATKITAGTINSARINADEISANIANFDAAKITSGTINSARIGNIELVGINNFDVKSANTGARMEMNSERIDVFDDNGVLRVRIGKL